MPPMNFVFDVPLWILKGLESGEYVLNGGVVQDKAGKVVKWLQLLGSGGEQTLVQAVSPYGPVLIAGQALNLVAQGARDEGVKVGICGELAGDPEGAVLLLAMGYDILSMNATSLPKVKKALRNLRVKEAQGLLGEVKEMDNANQIRHRLEEFLSDHGMEKFIHNPVE